MARYEHLPVYRKAYLLALAVEREVHRFSRFHKYAIGADLRELTRAILRRIIRANNQSAKRPDELEVLRTEVEEFLVLNRLAKDSRAFSGLKAYEECSPAAMAFEADLERNLFSLGEELRSRSYRLSPSVCFITDQPKRREIFAAAFRDRVVHHLVVRHIEPYWEPKFIHDSFACRRNKGTHAAVDRVQHFLRRATANGSRHAWILHLDIRSFFVRINKAVLFRLLADGLKRQEAPWESEMHWLIKCIVFSDPTQSVHRIGSGFAAVPNHKSLFQTGNICGLPIGNYTSQFFANVYLNPLDQFVKHNLRMRHYVRYVDDLILNSRDREALVEAEQRIGCFLDKELKLELNGNRRRLAAASSGIDALGYVIHTHHRLLRRRTLRRFQRRLRAGEQALPADLRKWNGFRVDTQQSEKLLAQSMSYRGLLQKASCQRLVQRIQQKYCLPGFLWRLDLRNRVRRRYRLTGTPQTLIQQWRMFREQWPGARLLMQVGGYWEAYGDDADWLRKRLALDEGRSRRGLGRSAGFSVRDVPGCAQCSVAPGPIRWSGYVRPAGSTET